MKLSVTEIQAIVAEQIDNATGGVGDEITEQRRKLLDAQFAEPYGDETEFRSAVVSSDVADTIEWIMPEIMEIMAGGDKVVQFAPIGPDDEARAEQETDTVNHVLMRQNDGWLVLYSWFKDALGQKNGYVKRYWETKKTDTKESYEGLSGEEVVKLFESWQRSGLQVTIEEQEESIGPDGQPAYDITARLVGETEREVVCSVPPDELIVSSQWSSVNLDEAPFVAHCPNGRTVSDLIAAGYDRKQVEGLSSEKENDASLEREARFSTRDHEEETRTTPAGAAMRSVEVWECYLRLDLNDDGIAELVKVTVAGPGREILKWAEGGHDIEEVPSQPFSALTPIIVPHRHYGRSVAELVDDLQRIKTVLLRQMLDNIYLTNNPTREIAEGGIGESTIADLLVDRPGKIVRTLLPGHYVEHSPAQFMGQMLPAIEYVDSLRENRTGVTRYNQGLDANSLNKTAAGVNQIMSAAQKKVMLIARIFAETGVKHLMRGIHADLRRNASKAMTIRLRGQYVPVDPRHWIDRSDVEVNVALGTGNRDQRIMRLMGIAEKQEMHMANGSPLVTMKNLHHTYEKIVEEAGFKNADAFFTDPNMAEPQPQQPPAPDPAQMMMQVEQMKIQAGQQEAAAKLQASQAEAQAKMQMEAMRARMEDDRERDRMNMEFALRVAEMNAKGITAVNIEQIKAAARSASEVNRFDG